MCQGVYSLLLISIIHLPRNISLKSYAGKFEELKSKAHLKFVCFVSVRTTFHTSFKAEFFACYFE